MMIRAFAITIFVVSALFVIGAIVFSLLGGPSLR